MVKKNAESTNISIFLYKSIKDFSPNNIALTKIKSQDLMTTESYLILVTADII